MGRRKRSSGVPAPRKRRPKQETFQAQFYTEDDIELAQAVCSVVKDLVCQVADEPYGDLTRKRPNLFNVLRKFIKDSVQAFQDAATAEYLSRTFKRTTRCEVEEEIPYGMDLVWGMVLSEMDKADKRERARLYSAQKAARLREKKKLEAEIEREQRTQEVRCQWDLRMHETLVTMELERLAALEATEQSPWPGCSVKESPSSEEENHREKKMNNFKPFIVHSDFTMPKATKMSPSPRSDDSDWAVPSRPTLKSQADPPVLDLESIPKYTLVPIGPNLVYPVSSDLFVPSGRGRGRGRGGRIPTVRSIINYAKDALPSQVKSDLPPHVSLLAPGQSKRVEPQFDFPNQKSKWDEKYIIKESRAPRLPRGRGSRGGVLTRKDRNLQLIMAAWDADAEEQHQQHLMAESIESSGESASQESNNDITNTINEVVTRVNKMSELDGRMGRKRTRIDKGKDRTSVQNAHGSRTADLNEPCTSTEVKRRKMDLITIDSESEDEEDESPTLGPTSPIRDSSIPPNQISKTSDNISSSSSSDIFIVE